MKYTMETFSEKRVIELKLYNQLDYESVPINTSFNIALITIDNKLVFGKRKDSYYLSEIMKIVNSDTKSSKRCMRTFCCLFQKLNNYEKNNILNSTLVANRENKDNRYKKISDYIKNDLDDYFKRNLTTKNHITKIKMDMDTYLAIANNENMVTYNGDDYTFIKNINKTLVLPGGKPIKSESIINTITRETNEELNINIADLNVSKVYYTKTTIYDKIIFKTFIDVTLIATIPLSSFQILEKFKPNREVSRVYFVNINKFNKFNFKSLLLFTQYLLIM